MTTIQKEERGSVARRGEGIRGKAGRGGGEKERGEHMHVVISTNHVNKCHVHSIMSRQIRTNEESTFAASLLIQQVHHASAPTVPQHDKQAQTRGNLLLFLFVCSHFICSHGMSKRFIQVCMDVYSNDATILHLGKNFPIRTPY